MDKGVRLYKSSSAIFFKIVVLIFFSAFTLYFLLSTFSDIHYLQSDLSFFSYYYKYPRRFITYVITVFIPSYYYSFVRGIVFYENGIQINRGLPFFNLFLSYNKIKSYRVIHPKFLMSVVTKSGAGEILFTLRDTEQAIAIFDQYGLEGSFSEDNLNTVKHSQRKFIVVIIIFTVLLYMIQHYQLLINRITS